MPARGKKAIDEALRLALAAGGSVPDAARKAGCSESTARRRLAESEFRQSVAAMRAELVSRAVGRLAGLGVLSVDTLRTLLQSASEKTRLGAVRTALEHMFRGTELEKVIAELEALKAEVERLTREKD